MRAIHAKRQAVDVSGYRDGAEITMWPFHSHKWVQANDVSFDKGDLKGIVVFCKECGAVRGLDITTAPIFSYVKKEAKQ